MKCPICHEETIGEDVQHWGPEYAHIRCVAAFNAGKADAADELCRLAAVEQELEASQAEQLEQCRIIGMSAERELALRAELEALRRAISEAEPQYQMHRGELCYKSVEDDQSFGMWCPAFDIPEGTKFYTLKGIK